MPGRLLDPGSSRSRLARPAVPGNSGDVPRRGDTALTSGADVSESDFEAVSRGASPCGRRLPSRRCAGNVGQRRRPDPNGARMTTEQYDSSYPQNPQPPAPQGYQAPAPQPYGAPAPQPYGYAPGPATARSGRRGGGAVS